MAKLSKQHKLRTAAWKNSLARRLLAWYQTHRRDLPWRQTADPYRIWVSEIMLQQTQVATVIPYYERFVRAFPTVTALAAADEQQVLRLWEGLGYYRRARQMHRAAQVIREAHDSQFPRELETVRSLPGIGRYTAGAIVSIAFDTPAPILEANTVRLFSRLIGFEGDTSDNGGQALLWQVAEEILPAEDCRHFNQAVMELGSLVCTPREPACERCPVSRLCAAFQKGRQQSIPRPRRKPKIELVTEAAVVIWRRGKVLLRRRATGERWAGFWDFLRFPVAATSATALRREIAAAALEMSGLTIEDCRKFTTLKHGVTRFRITLDCYHATVESGRARLARETWRWATPSELEGIPLSMTGRKITRHLLAVKSKREGALP